MVVYKKVSKRNESIIENEKDVLNQYDQILQQMLVYKKRRIIDEVNNNHIK